MQSINNWTQTNGISMEVKVLRCIMGEATKKPEGSKFYVSMPTQN